jgi:hypothetical protein
MNTRECRREQEIFEMVACGRWREACPEELRSHVTECALCADVLEVSLALYEEREAVFANVNVPPPGLVWWRAELRTRHEAMRTVSRPITLVQAFGGACTIGVIAGLVSHAWPWIKNVMAAIQMSDSSMSQWATLFAVALAVAVIGPVLYLVLSDE